MIVSHLALKNWRNFQSVNVDLGDRVFIVGANASGKSNLLDAFRFLRDIVKPGGGLQKAVSDRGGLSKIRCLAARKYPDVELEIHLSENTGELPLWKYAIGIEQENRGHRNPFLTYEKVWQGNELIVDRPFDADKDDYLRLTQTYLEQINANSAFRDISDFFKSVRYLHLVPQLVRSPSAFGGAGLPDDPYGMNFLEQISQTNDRTRNSRLSKIERALQKAVPQLKQLQNVKDERGIPHLEAIYEHWRSGGARQREDQFSDGTLRLIGLLWSLLEKDSMLLLEEPELSLNTAIVKKLAPIIHELQRSRKQVVLTTHSFELLSDPGISSDEVLLLTPNSEGTSVKSAANDAETKLQLEAGMTIADAVLPRTAPKNVYQLGLELFP